ncbi:hypothetical protein ACWCO9_32340, partial [Streptomyces sp. NPDC001937]
MFGALTGSLTGALSGALHRCSDLGLRLSHESRLTRGLPRNQRKSLIDGTVLLGSTGRLGGMSCVGGAGHVGRPGHIGGTGHLRYRGLRIAASS